MTEARFDRSAVEAFLIHEAALLDDREFEQWRDLFDEDGYYWVPLRPDQKSPEGESSLFYDDRKVMQTRIERLRHPRIHSQTPPHRTCHLIGNVAVDLLVCVAGCLSGLAIQWHH
jgi:benzoate/toluate 1,2-dioxygenase beta subunit